MSDLTTLGIAEAGRLRGGQQPELERAHDLAGAHRVDPGAFRLEQAQQVDIRVGLLGKTHVVEDLERRQAATDGGGVVQPERGAMGLAKGGQEIGGQFELVHG